VNGQNALKTHLLIIFGKYFGIGGQNMGYEKNQPLVFICNL